MAKTVSIKTFSDSSNNQNQGKRVQKGMNINVMRDTANNAGQGLRGGSKAAGAFGVKGASPRKMRGN